MGYFFKRQKGTTIVNLKSVLNYSKKRLTKYGSIKVVDSITSILKNG